MANQDEQYSVLIVDDSDPDRQTLCRYLSKALAHSFTVYEAESVDAGLKLLTQEKIDCVLLDYDFPGHDGFYFIKKLDANFPELKGIPIIMLTGMQSADVASAAIKFEISDYLLKSNIDPASLEKSVIAAIGRAQMRRDLFGKTKKINEMNVRLRKENDLLASYFHVLSHELITPIAMINVFASELKERCGGCLEEKDKEYLDHISANCLVLKAYADDLIDMRQLDSGKSELNLSNFSVASMLNKIFKKYQSQAVDKKLSFDCEVSEGLPLLRADEARLCQILHNMITNAFRFTEKGGIKIGAYQKNNDSAYVYFYVEDTGPGIPTDMQEAIFDRLVQATEGDMGGIGLGLAIAKRLIEMQGGEIFLESSPGRGSTFTFTLCKA